MRRKMAVILIAAVILLTSGGIALAGEENYLKPVKVYDIKLEAATYESAAGIGWPGYDSFPKDIPLYIRTYDCYQGAPLGSHQMVVRVGVDGIEAIHEMNYLRTRSIPAGIAGTADFFGPMGWEVITIDGVPWQIYESPGVYNDSFSEEYKKFLIEENKNSPGKGTTADEVRYVMETSVYRDCQHILPEEGKKMVSVYNGQRLSVFYTSKTADMKFLKAKPYIKDGVMMVPIRGVIDYLGAEIGWDAKEKMAVIRKDGKEIRLKPGDSNIYVNGTVKNMGTVPEISEGCLMVPLRFLSDELGYKIRWITSKRDASVKIADIYN